MRHSAVAQSDIYIEVYSIMHSAAIERKKKSTVPITTSLMQKSHTYASILTHSHSICEKGMDARIEHPNAPSSVDYIIHNTLSTFARVGTAAILLVIKRGWTYA